MTTLSKEIIDIINKTEGTSLTDNEIKVNYKDIINNSLKLSITAVPGGGYYGTSNISVSQRRLEVVQRTILSNGTYNLMMVVNTDLSDKESAAVQVNNLLGLNLPTDEADKLLTVNWTKVNNINITGTLTIDTTNPALMTSKKPKDWCDKTTIFIINAEIYLPYIIKITDVGQLPYIQGNPGLLPLELFTKYKDFTVRSTVTEDIPDLSTLKVNDTIAANLVQNALGMRTRNGSVLVGLIDPDWDQSLSTVKYVIGSQCKVVYTGTGSAEYPLYPGVDAVVVLDIVDKSLSKNVGGYIYMGYVI